MLIKFSSLRRKMLFYATALFCLPLFVCISFSYIYLHRENINNQYLLQQNMMIMCKKELEDNIFYSKISELSNLSIIRNELYRLYRIVDMSLYAPQVKESYHAVIPDSYTYHPKDQSQLPSPNLYTHNYASNNTSPSEHTTQSGSATQSGPATQSDGTNAQQGITTPAAPVTESDIALDSDIEVYTPHLSDPRVFADPELKTPEEFRAQLEQNKSHDSDQALAQKEAEESFFIATSEQTVTDRLVLYNHLRQMQSLGFIAFSVNIKDERLNLFINEQNRDLLDELYNNQKSLYDHLYKDHTPEDGYFLILRQKEKVPSIEQQGHASQSTENTDSSASNDALASTNTTDTSAMTDNGASSGAMATTSTSTTATNTPQTAHKNPDNFDFQQGINRVPVESKINNISAAERTLNEIRNKEQLLQVGADPSINNELLRRSIDLHPNMIHGIQRNEPMISLQNSYLSIVAPLSFTPDQLLVIITDISKLQQQDEVLKRLIANSLNDMVLSVGLTTPLSITLLDEKMQPLAGDLSSAEISRLITPHLLYVASENDMFQGYNKRWGHYLTIGHFKPYNWYILINSDNVRANSMLWQYMLILFMSGFVLAVLAVHIIGAMCEKDAKEIRLISNKIKHMATLFQDPSLLTRVCDGLPRRDDEIGMLSSNVRLMAKTLYQSLQEMLHNTEMQVIDQGERNIISRLRQMPLNREIFLKEYYKNRFNVHTEMAPHSNGDFYDVIELNENKLAIFVGSVNEQGIDAANISNLNICLIRQMIRLTQSLRISLPVLIGEINQNITENNAKNVLTSLCVVIIDQRTGKVEYLNAGHTLPILYHHKEGFEYIDLRTGPVLGLRANQVFTSVTLQLEDRDSLLLYTDGLLDCTNRRLEKLGQEGLENMLHDEGFNNATDTINNLVSKLKCFTRDQEQEKDYTIACYQFYANSVDPSPRIEVTGQLDYRHPRHHLRLLPVDAHHGVDMEEPQHASLLPDSLDLYSTPKDSADKATASDEPVASAASTDSAESAVSADAESSTSPAPAPAHSQSEAEEPKS